VKTKLKQIIKITLLIFIAASIFFAIYNEFNKSGKTATSPANSTVGTLSQPRANDRSSTTSTVNDKIIVYYFHGNARCQSCLLIEKYSHAAIEDKFKNELKNGELEWRVINVEEPRNSHYVQDYRLYTKSLILSLVKKGQQKNWKNLEKVWTYLRNEDDFYSYVQNEVASYLTELKK
jgi:hypothetical protein